MASDDETPDLPRPSTSDEATKNQLDEQTNEPSEAGALQVAGEDKGDDEYIRLRVITSDMTNEVHFRVKAATTLGRLKRSYCSKLGHQMEELRFVFDGHRITDEDTPKSLGMIDDDVIEIYQERTGGGRYLI